MIHVEVANQQTLLPVDTERLIRVARAIVAEFGPDSAELSLTIVDDATIHELNRQYLQHDYPTDVLSFPLEQDEQHLEGEVIVSAETAQRVAAEYDWSADEELLLYIVHGMLHLVGFDDHEEADRAAMREQEERFIKQFAAN